MTFDKVIGQVEVKNHLRQMMRDNCVPHALMFCGPSGAGKLPLALSFASSLLCVNPTDGEACGKCASCRMLQEWGHPDLHFSFPVYKKKSTDRPVSDDFVSQWREQLKNSIYFSTRMWLEDIKAENQQIVHYVYESDVIQRKLGYKSNQGGRKVVLMWLPERMNTEMANRLLKLIEEPPALTHFLFVSEDPDMVLGTIQSRVQRIQVPALEEETIVEALVREHALPKALAEDMAHVSMGSYTEALKRIVAGNEEQLFFDLFKQLMRLSYMRKIKDMRQWSYTVADMGREQQKRLLTYFQRLLRENFIYNFRKQELLYETEAEKDFSKNFAQFINERNVMTIMDELADAQRDIEQNVNAKMVFFDFALKMIVQLKQ